MAPVMNPVSTPPPMPRFGEALRFWVKLGFISFGGPAGQIAIMHRELVEKRRWISEGHFLHALNFCMLLPGPEAQQLATYLGWRLHGARGGIAAGGLFVLPSVFILLALSWLYMAGGELRWVEAIFQGLNPAVMAIVFGAVLRIGRKALKTPTLWVLAGLSFVAMQFGDVSFLYILGAAVLVGWVGAVFLPGQFSAARKHGPAADDEANYVTLPPAPRVTWGRTLWILGLCLALWWLPVVAAGTALGWNSTLAKEGVFFSKAAVVTFGGAYAVLPYVIEHTVEEEGWLTKDQASAGLALAETTPGPLIMVLQFVGFAAGWQHPGPFTPLLGGTLGALITTWTTFLPCFLFIFLGGPHVEHLRERRALSAILTAITAAVVGVILKLAVWFSHHAIFPENAASPDWWVIGVAIAALVAMERFKVGMIVTIAVCAGLGLIRQLVYQG